MPGTFRGARWWAMGIVTNQIELVAAAAAATFLMVVLIALL